MRRRRSSARDRLEHDLAIGRLNDDGTILMFPTRRPNQTT
jgi:hypothetical protein